MISFACSLQREDFAFDVAFSTDAGITALIGPSGSGKSTTIRLLAGIDKPARGEISANGSVLLNTGQGLNVAAHKRRIGLVFQDAYLFPHLSVRSNLTYGRWFARRFDNGIAFDAVVEVLGIGPLLDRRPQTLSGGERQRVAIGRALLSAPRLLLMDEPLASLDSERKLELLPFIARMHREFAIPILYVSHAMDEVALLAQKIVKLEKGRVVAVGEPSEVLGR